VLVLGFRLDQVGRSRSMAIVSRRWASAAGPTLPRVLRSSRSTPPGGAGTGRGSSGEAVGWIGFDRHFGVDGSNGPSPSSEASTRATRGISLHETTSGIQAPTFNFTAYVRWKGFRERATELEMGGFNNEMEPILEAAWNQLKEHFRLRSTQRDGDVVRRWIDEDSYPYRGELGSDAPAAAPRGGGTLAGQHPQDSYRRSPSSMSSGSTS
jgi:hypothetical protein